MDRFCNQKTEKGFTLVETLVAIAILLLVVIGPMTVAQKGIQSAYFANEQTTAVFLAQEAIEAVRTSRDSVALAALDEPSVDTSDWVADFNCEDGCSYSLDGGFDDCAPGGCPKLKVAADGRYNMVDGIDSPFIRTVTISDRGDGNAEVKVDVTWTAQVFGNVTRTVTLRTWVYDHYQRYGS